MKGYWQGKLGTPPSIIVERVKDAGVELGATFRISKTGTPMLVKTVGDTTMSIVWLNGFWKWRIFWPWPSYQYPGEGQQKMDLPTVAAVKQFLDYASENALKKRRTPETSKQIRLDL